MPPPEPTQLATTPSVFLSYASEDRPAVRRLRDALVAAGLEVWYDENELTGGDAWDRKIRRQIRECTYFMPIISATTNARAEGYFRREWRMGVERTQDMADDVIFLLPVTIDDSEEGTARVPEHFLKVQWLRVPDGEATPALKELCARLLSGGSHQLPKPPASAPRATAARSPSTPPPGPAATPADDDLSPPMGKEWWRWLTRIWKKTPRWVRFCLWGILVISALNTCTQCSDESPKRSRQTSAARNSDDPANFDPKVIQQTLQEALKVAGAAKNAGKRQKAADVAVLAFTGGKQAGAVQQDIFTKLTMTGNLKIRLSPLPLMGTPGDVTPVDRGRAEGARFVLGAASATLANGNEVLRVKLERVIDGATIWSGDVTDDENPQIAGARLYSEILPLVLTKE